MLLDNPQTLRHGDGKVWCYVSQDDHCFLVVPGEMLTRFGQDGWKPRMSGLLLRGRYDHLSESSLRVRIDGTGAGQTRPSWLTHRSQWEREPLVHRTLENGGS